MIPWSPAQLAQMRSGMAAWFAGLRYGEVIPEIDQCCDYGADGCEGRALESGWCGACSAKLFPPRTTSA